ncbi:hypothetical protein JCM21714_3940 [Gracilibacillus boraciitolerans JCM 21714]|uniref:Uncharacterized protein n=1 Tax=Gracilibacillus boraciitolerans JCM 21714 TaxID=1298598 RepID=W4VNG9_9BACI|nr:hypothetical protein JCM21714_3940 [Gracilibacillus boraciitolerans JCM 21714]
MQFITHDSFAIYEFIKGSEFNINRFMDPYAVKDFRLRVNEFEFYPDIEIYDEFEDNKLIFFEGSESALISIKLNESGVDIKHNILFHLKWQIILLFKRLE